ncbi:MAG: diaminopropionate ammonia-lyase [Alphaproteobacteria bacterium]|nr:diaminopropionate ammonia-lyase [Alphaproteobacteria bacterium]
MMGEAAPLSLAGEGFGLVRNRFATAAPIPAPAHLQPADFAAAAAAIRGWEGYAPSPLHPLGWAAAEAGVAAVLYKDESPRFGLESFKALGGAYAVGRQVAAWQAAGRDPAELTVCCASDGNHGRSVAWGAARYGCRAVVFVPEVMAPARRAAIERYGARTVTVSGYDEGLKEAARQAEAKGWVVVSDTSYPGYETIPQDVMAGYGLIAEEAVAQWDAPPTHLFLQAGVGGMAAALALRFRQLGVTTTLVVCEAAGAACWFRSLAEGEWQAVESQGTIQAGLDCGEPSVLAWDMLRHHALASAWVDDRRAGDAVRRLAQGRPALAAGESAVAGLATLLAAGRSASARAMLDLRPDSRVFILGSEGPTDPEGHARILANG